MKEAAEILGIKEPRRIKNYSDVPGYGIRPMHVGKGQGSRKLYTYIDIEKIAIAEQLAKCGFAPWAIGEALGEIPQSLLAAKTSADLSDENKSLLVMRKHRWETMRMKQFQALREGDEMNGIFAFDIQNLVEDVLRDFVRWTGVNV